MISVLVCSLRPDLLQQLSDNISKTIGVTYEIIAFDNKLEKKGLAEVYNILGERAKFDILCFLHEDILITTQNWGSILLQLFSKKNVGAVGVAGSKYKSAVCSGWFTGQKEFDCANITHRLPKTEEKIYLNPLPGTLMQEVVCLDGVFICTRKPIWTQIRFDEKRLKGFHLYDIDFSIRVSRILTSLVTYEIDIVHITKGGDFTNVWMEYTIQYHREHQAELPFTKDQIKPSRTEAKIALATLDVLKNYSISLKNKTRWIIVQNLYRFPNLYYGILKFLVYRPFGLRRIHKFFK